MKEIHGGNLVGRGGAGLLVDVGGREDGAPVVKDLVWIPDEEKVWRAVRMVQAQECLSPKGKKPSVENEVVGVILPGQAYPIEIPKRDTHVHDPSHALDLDDASKMNQMHEAPLLDLLFRRFRQDTIYTNVADVLISVNPYKNIPLLYEVPLQQMQDESGDEFEESDGERQDSNDGDNTGNVDSRPAALRNKLSKPHVFSVADRAFRFMTGPGREYAHGKQRGKNQSIIITGESGAGKTEASKQVMRYLITASQLLVGGVQEPEGGDLAPAKRIEDVLLRSNTVLEAFGNAKTVRNDNSSRFGKYIKLLYDGSFRLIGAKTEHFLLEKSRLVKVDPGERGYHIFYQLLAGLDAKRARGLFLGSAEGFHAVAQGDCVTVSDEVDDLQEFRETDKAMNTLGFGQADKDAIFRVLAALLHLGNVDIQETANPEQGQAKATMRMATPSNAYQDAKQEDAAGVAAAGVGLENVAGLLGLEADCLVRKVTWRAIITPHKSCHEIPLTALEARDNLSALSKHTYGKLFSWIVGSVNRCHIQQITSTNDEAQQQHSKPREGTGNQHRRGSDDGGVASVDGNGLGEGYKENVMSFIGILDIFGFEIMTTNSFEQLCINFANEVLQRQFNHHIFVLEQAEYKAEGLDVEAILFRDNQSVIDLIAKKPLGLMVILEDQVLTGRKAHATNKLTDRSVLDLYHQEHSRRHRHPDYEKPRIECDQFILKHFAGRVTYNVTGFLEKNNDSLQDDLRALLLDSDDPFVSLLARTGTGGASVLSPGEDDSLPRPPPNGAARPASRRVSEGRDEIKLANRATVSSIFRRQLDDLVNQLRETEPHYIKCIKPNSGKAPGGWSSPVVIEQLRYSGVLEVVRIRREAYPTRIGYPELFQRFRQLLQRTGEGIPKTAAEVSSEAQLKEFCVEICRVALAPGEFQMGTNKVFLKSDALDKLRWALQEKYVAAAREIQTRWRVYAEYKHRVRKAAAATAIQARWLGFVAARKYRRMLSARRKARLLAATAVQRLARGRVVRVAFAQAKETRRIRTLGQVQMARIARGFVSRKKFAEQKSAVTALQTWVRAYLTRKAYAGWKTSQRLKRERVARRATRLQAWSRMVIARRAHGRTRAASTTIASAWRTKVAVANMRRDVRRIIIAQAIARGHIARRRYVRHLSWIVSIQAFTRGFLRRRYFLRARSGARRLQRCIRAWRRNLELQKNCLGVFAAARKGDVREVTRIVTDWPEMLYVRDRYGESPAGSPGTNPPPCYDTLLHAACQSGLMDVVVLLEPFPTDVTERDRDGNSCFHIAALAADYEAVKYLARRYNMDVAQALKQDYERRKLAQRLSRRQVSTSVNVFKAARLDRARWISERVNTRTCQSTIKNVFPTGTVIISGYLRKRRETDRWLRRWCILTETSLAYYHKQSDCRPSKIIPLEKAMLKKSEHVDFAFEIHTPDLLDKKNREGRLYFQSAGEKELQRWMVPLRMVVAHYQFRNDKRGEPMVYLDVEWRKLLMQLGNKAGDTPLHMAARAQGREGVFEEGGAGGVTLAGTGNNFNTAAPGILERGGGPDAGEDGHVDDGNPGGGILKLPEQEMTTNKRSCVQRLIAWIIANGADPNALNSTGDTPLHVAVESGNAPAVATLARRGGSPAIERRSDGRTAMELAIHNGEVAQFVDGENERQRGLLDLLRSTNNSLLPPPVKLYGFTYASFYLEKTTFPPSGVFGALETSSTVPRGVAGSGGGGVGVETIGGEGALRGAGVGDGAGVNDSAGLSASNGVAGGQQQRADLVFFVTVTVYSGKGMPIEAQQDIVLPIMTGPDYLWWAHTWHMQTPLETLGPGSFVIFELIERMNAMRERKTRPLCWGVFHLNPDEINTRSESISTYIGPPDPTLKRMKPSDFTFLGETFLTVGDGHAIQA